MKMINNGRGGYWVVLSTGIAADETAAAPTVAVRVSRDGNVTKALDGFSFVSVSEVAQRGGALWVGSVDTPYAGQLKWRAG
jgi:hypothetical protein